MKNIEALKQCIHNIDTQSITVRQASMICKYTTNHIRKVLKQYRIFGDSVFIHKSTGRKPSTTVPIQTRRQIVKIYQEEFCSDAFNCTFHFFYDCLPDHLPDLKICYKTVYNILTQAGIDSPEKRHVDKKKDVHRPRARRQCEGELLQIDATPYQWFLWAGDDKYYSLHGSIDDATGHLTGLYACKNECLFGYLELIRQTFYMSDKGHPCAVYSDRAAIFCNTKKGASELTVAEQLQGLHEKRTQWQRVLDELNVKQILAWSPQAKGRVERMWHTIQQRLPYYLKKHNIKTIEEMNAFLPEFIKIYNERFGVKPASPVKVWHKTFKDPDYVLSVRITRHVYNNGTFKLQGYTWIIKDAHFAGKDFELCISEKGIRAYKNNKFYEVQLLEDIQELERGDTMTEVLKAIIYKYMYEDGKSSVAA